MKKLIKYLAFVLVLVACCVGTFFLTQKEVHTPSFMVMGDVKEVKIIDNLETYEKTTFSHKDKNLQGVSLDKIIDNKRDENSKLVFVGSDGLTSQVDAGTVTKSYLLFSEENGWELINLEHPISSNIKHLKEIIVVSQEEYSKTAFTIFNEEENLFMHTVGQMMMQNYEFYRKFEGQSTYNENDVSVYTPHKIFDLKELIGDKSDVNYGRIFLENGKIEDVELNGYIDIKNNQVDYVSYNKDYEYQDVRGIFLGTDLGHVSDVYYDMEHYLNKGEKVMTIFIDGFNYQTYEKAKKRGIIPNISNGKLRKSLSVHTSVTNAGYASMITGVTPDINGVHNRDHRDLKVDSIFKLAKDLGINTSYLEADIKILNTEITPRLHTGGDFEIIKTAEKDIENGAEFVFIHLHELDNLGHLYGPQDKSLYEYLEKIDKALEKIMLEFDGEIIISTDHGMHDKGEAGDHGNMCYEDMIIPIISID